MSDQPKTVLLIRKFEGVDLDAEILVPDELPPGTARTQINLSSAEPGFLRTRAGVKVVSFTAGG